MALGYLFSLFTAFWRGHDGHAATTSLVRRHQNPIGTADIDDEFPDIDLLYPVQKRTRELSTNAAQSVDRITRSSKYVGTNASKPAKIRTTTPISGNTTQIRRSNGQNKWPVEEPLYYAVKIGHKPGIYTSWSAARKQVTGYSGALHQKFENYEEAIAFMESDESEEEDCVGTEVVIKKEEPESSLISTRGVLKYYAVRRGRKPGIYTSWSDTQTQVHGFSRARYKSFPTLQEAREFMAVETITKSRPSTRKRSIVDAPREVKRRKIFAKFTTTVEVEETNGMDWKRAQKGRKIDYIYMED